MASASLPAPTTCSRQSAFRPPVVLPQKICRTKRRNIRKLDVSCEYSCIEIKDLSYQLPGTKINLLHGVNLSLREKSFGLIFGRSGSGKTTLLQLIAGLSKPTSGSICIQRYGDDGCPNKSPELLNPERVGIVFQFPERYSIPVEIPDCMSFHLIAVLTCWLLTTFYYLLYLVSCQILRLILVRYFVGDNVLNELTFGWPIRRGSLQSREVLASRFAEAIKSVGLTGVSLNVETDTLSGGYKRRLALAIQLVQAPNLLLLDEPLAGLDWKARADVVKLLEHLKKEFTLLVVSHDLNEFSALVDQSWRMEMGGTLESEPLPVSF